MSVLLWVIAIGLPILLVVAWRRGRKVSSGVAGALAEVSEMLDPGQPRAEILSARRDGEVDPERDEDREP